MSVYLVSRTPKTFGRGARWTATVRVHGIPSLSRTFPGPKDTLARRWADEVERAMEESLLPRGRPFVREDHLVAKPGKQSPQQVSEKFNPDLDARPRVDWTIRRALAHYQATVTPTKKGAAQERRRVAWWTPQHVCAKRLNELTPGELQDHVRARAKSGLRAQTVRNEMHLLSALYRHAAGEPDHGDNPDPWSPWGLRGLANPVDAVKLPPQSAPRERRFQDGEPGQPSEEERIRDALATARSGGLVGAALTLAVETGMRMGELLAVERGDLRREQGARIIQVADSKNGTPRRVVLSSRAGASVDFLIGRMRPDAPATARLLPVTEYGLRGTWRRALKKAGVTGLRWHDMRHEALSRLASLGLHVGQMQQQSGHKTVKILVGYIQSRADEVAAKLG